MSYEVASKVITALEMAEDEHDTLREKVIDALRYEEVEEFIGEDENKITAVVRHLAGETGVIVKKANYAHVYLNDSVIVIYCMNQDGALDFITTGAAGYENTIASLKYRANPLTDDQVESVRKIHTTLVVDTGEKVKDMV